MKATLTDWLISALAYIVLCALFTLMGANDEIISETNTVQHQEADVSTQHHVQVTLNDKKARTHENQNSGTRR